MQLLRNLGLTALIFLAILGIVVDVGYVFYLLFDKTTTTDIFNINDQAPVDLKDQEDLTENEIKTLEDRRLFEVNLYSNVDTKKNNEKTGVILQELKLNYFTNYSLGVKAIISTGMQYVSDYNGLQGLYTSDGAYAVNNKISTAENIAGFLFSNPFDVLGKSLNNVKESSGLKEFKNEAAANDYVSPNFNYYESVNGGVTWNAKGLQTQLNRKTEFIVKIADDAYKLRLDGYQDNRWDNSPKGIEWLNPFKWGKANDKGGYIAYYNWDMVFEDIMSAVLTNNMTTGTHYGVVNLSKYFTVTQHFNNEDGKWYPASDADQQITYAVVKFNYNTKGAISNQQSIFGIIDDNPRFKLDDVVYDTDYGYHDIVFEMTTASLQQRYSELYDGYFLSLSLDLQRQLKAMPPYRINLTINLGQVINGKKIVGLDVNAFDGFPLEKLTITGNQDFYLLDNSLRNTNIATFNISPTVNIINVNSGVTL